MQEEICLFEGLDFENSQNPKKNETKKPKLDIKTNIVHQLVYVQQNLLFNEAIDEDIEKIDKDAEEIDELAQKTAEVLGLQNFMKQVGRTKVLKREEEKSLFIQYKENPTIEIRNQIIEANLKMVVSVAIKISKKYIKHPLEDLINDGVFGLIRAIEKFEIERGNKFSTYAYPWIMQSITRSIANCGETIRLPVHFSDYAGKIKKLENEYAITHGSKYMSDEEVAKKLNIPIDKAKDYRYALKVQSSIDAPISEDSNKTLCDTIVDENRLNPEDGYIVKEKSEIIRQSLKALEPIEAMILSCKFGLCGYEDTTIAQISKKTKIPKERIRAIESSALRKMKNILTEKMCC